MRAEWARGRWFAAVIAAGVAGFVAAVRWCLAAPGEESEWFRGAVAVGALAVAVAGSVGFVRRLGRYLHRRRATGATAGSSSIATNELASRNT